MNTKPKILFGEELAYPGEYLAVEDLKGASRPVTIEEVALFEGRQKGDKQKLVATLIGKKKKWIINVTNATDVARAYGLQAKAWAGCTVYLKPDTCKVGRDTVACIRVDTQKTMAAKKAGPKAPTPQTWDDLDQPVDEAELVRGAAEAENA
jgi:hypothetical protein